MDKNQTTIFQVGKTYTNDQIRFSLGVENLGGIRPSVDEKKNLRYVAIMTSAEESEKRFYENPYVDRIENDILIYTAQGRSGDQQITGRNKRLLEQYQTPIPFYGFANVGKQIYRFLGLLELLRHYQELQIDKQKTTRKVWVFEFRIHQEPNVVPINLASEITAEFWRKSHEQQSLVEEEREIVEDIEETKTFTPSLVEVEDLRARLLQIPPYNFEHLVKEVMKANEFRDVSVTAASGDGGIDINAYVKDSNDFFAGTHVQVQVKRWRHSVGRVEINNFRGALSITAKGIFITTGFFTRAALIEARHNYKPSITLIDGTKLSSIVIRSKINPQSFSQ
ncbi:MAG: restriction endonuclease [Acidobacteriota bacterium]|nr:restriction endonuclease [Acidobacteriota bacterium]